MDAAPTTAARAARPSLVRVGAIATALAAHALALLLWSLPVSHYPRSGAPESTELAIFHPILAAPGCEFPAKWPLPVDPAQPQVGELQGDVLVPNEDLPAGGQVLVQQRVRAVSTAFPQRPDGLREAAPRAPIRLHLRIGKEGRALAVTVLRGSGDARLDELVRQTALRHWRFSPARRHGAPIASGATVTVSFGAPAS